MEKTHDRNAQLDNLKGLLIFLVVLGHSLELYKGQSLFMGTLYMYIYLFHMPVFVFISGYLSKNIDKCRETAFTRFFLPFLIFNTLWNLIATLVIKDYTFSFITPGWALWYLLSMFFWRMSIKDLNRVKYILPVSIFIGLGSGFFGEFDGVLSLSRTLVFFPFFLVGFRMDESTLLKSKRPPRSLSLVIFVVTLITALMITYFDLIPVELLYGASSFNTFKVHILISLCTRIALYILGFSYVFVLFNTITSKQSFLTKIGKNTFPIYILHTYLICILFAINYFIPWLFIQFVICILGSLFITYLLSRNCVSKYFNLFLEKTIGSILKY